MYLWKMFGVGTVAVQVIIFYRPKNMLEHASSSNDPSNTWAAKMFVRCSKGATKNANEEALLDTWSRFKWFDN